MTNEELAFSILRHDPTAKEWVFNYYCSGCARFLHSEDLASGLCKKCKTSTKDKVGYSIPFLSSATALEKLIVWVRDLAMVHDDFANIRKVIEEEIVAWLYRDDPAVSYRQAIIDKVGTILDHLPSRTATRSSKALN